MNGENSKPVKPLMHKVEIRDANGTLVGCRTVQSEDIKLGAGNPIPLNPDEQYRVDAVWLRIGLYAPLNYQMYIDGFIRDHPDYRHREISIWEKLASQFEGYVSTRNCPRLGQRCDVFNVLLSLSMGTVDITAVLEVPEWLVEDVRAFVR